jgi:hypothetical protein
MPLAKALADFQSGMVVTVIVILLAKNILLYSEQLPGS